ncbi:hypothetical protein CCACVL1_06831 [Corchorus capsularis]|uniref:Uncharacterized protein n=1 Tax=Corchorus capsularis TaxID=210143 RepID=A0A1R3JCN3_COCAP|nr:hypothetical protein CCACVL1_06831 [Corchorus capsularis]
MGIAEGFKTILEPLGLLTSQEPIVHSQSHLASYNSVNKSPHNFNRFSTFT